MKFQPDAPLSGPVVTRVEPGRVWVGGVAYGHSLLVPWNGPVQPWDVATPAALLPEHFERVAALRPEVVVFGSGARLRFPQPGLLRALIDLHIGVETMDTAAACRTYNVLASEGRRVLAALLIGPGAA
jgi:uncharacterized protein